MNPYLYLISLAQDEWEYSVLKLRLVMKLTHTLETRNVFYGCDKNREVNYSPYIIDKAFVTRVLLECETKDVGEGDKKFLATNTFLSMILDEWIKVKDVSEV